VCVWRGKEVIWRETEGGRGGGTSANGGRFGALLHVGPKNLKGFCFSQGLAARTNICQPIKMFRFRDAQTSNFDCVGGGSRTALARHSHASLLCNRFGS